MEETYDVGRSHPHHPHGGTRIRTLDLGGGTHALLHCCYTLQLFSMTQNFAAMAASFMNAFFMAVESWPNLPLSSGNYLTGLTSEDDGLWYKLRPSSLQDLMQRTSRDESKLMLGDDPTVAASHPAPSSIPVLPTCFLKPLSGPMFCLRAALIPPR